MGFPDEMNRHECCFVLSSYYIGKAEHPESSCRLCAWEVEFKKLVIAANLTMKVCALERGRPYFYNLPGLLLPIMLWLPFFLFRIIWQLSVAKETTEEGECDSFA